MAKNRTESSKYPSRYSPNAYVTSVQYILELLCENKAKTLKKDLPVKFWELEEWSSFYRSQLRVTHKLLRTYNEQCIIAVIKSYNIWSLHPKFVIEKLEAEKRRQHMVQEQQRAARDERLFLEDLNNHVSVESGDLPTNRERLRSNVSKIFDGLD